MSADSENLLSMWLNRVSPSPEGAVTPADRTKPLNASYAQQGMWLADVIAEDADRSSVVQHSWCLRGALDVQALRRTFDALRMRHEAWRTGFHESDGALLQVVVPEAAFDFEVSTLNASDAATLERAIVAAYREPMDLAHGLVARARLFVLDQEHHVLLVTIHHIAFDGWSFGIFQRELEAMYAAACLVPAELGVAALQEAADLPSLPVQYADYAVWQRSCIESGRCDASLAYWTDYLAGAPERLDLPTDRALPPARSSAGDRVTSALTRDLLSTVQSRAAEWSTTVFCLQLTAFLLTLARWSGQRDIVLGITLAGRKETQIEELIGFFVNVLPLRCRLDPQEPVAAVVGRVHHDLLRMHDHDDVALEFLLQHLAVPRRAAYKPLVQVTVASHQNLTRPLTLEGLEVAYLPPVNLDVQEDLTLFFTSAAEHVEAHIAYSTDLFVRDTVAGLADGFAAALARLCSEPQARVQDFGIEPTGAAPREAAAAAPADQPDTDAADDELVEIEAAMIEIWREVLPKPPTDADANFFALGGTSLAALRACNRASALFGVRVPVRKLFEHGTVRGLSRVVAELLASAEVAP